MAKKRKRKRWLTPGLAGLRPRRPRLPGRRAPAPVVAVTEPEPVVSGLPSVARRPVGGVLPPPVDYSPDIDTLGEAVLALGDRVDQMARREG